MRRALREANRAFVDDDLEMLFVEILVVVIVTIGVTLGGLFISDAIGKVF
jgi:hypothetical protein